MATDRTHRVRKTNLVEAVEVSEGSEITATAVLAEAASIAAEAEAHVAAEAASSAAQAAARAKATAAEAAAVVEAATAETAAAMSAAVSAEAGLSAATATMAPTHPGAPTAADAAADHDVAAALRVAASATATLAAAAAGQRQATSLAAGQVVLAVTLAAAAAAAAANAQAVAVHDEVTAAAADAASVAATLATRVAATVGTPVQAAAGTAAETAGEPVITALTRLTCLVAGLDDSVRSEWEERLSSPVTPTSLPGVDGGVQTATTAPVGLRGLIRDLTLARRMELALSGSEQRFQVTFDHAPGALLLAAFDGRRLGRFIQVNPAMCRLTGYSAAELLTLDPRALSHPENDVVPADLLDNPAGAGGDRQEVRRWMHAAGHSIWVRINLSPVFDSDGRPEYVVGQVEDISARRCAEATLRHSAEQFRSAFDDAPIAMLLIRLPGARTGGLLRANRAACRLTGYTEPELLGCDLPTLLGQTSAEASLSWPPSGDYAACERFRHADGHTFWVQLRAHVVAGENGEDDCLIAQIQETG